MWKRSLLDLEGIGKIGAAPSDASMLMMSQRLSRAIVKLTLPLTVREALSNGFIRVRPKPIVAFMPP